MIHRVPIGSGWMTQNLSSFQALPTQGIWSCFKEVPFPPSSPPTPKEKEILMARNGVRNRSHSALFLPSATRMILLLSGTLPKSGILANWKRTVIQLLEKVAEFVMQLLGELTTKGRGVDSQSLRDHPV